MTGRVVDLGPEVGLVWSKKFPNILVEQRRRHPLLPSMDGIAKDLWAAGPQVLIPARLERGQQNSGASLKIYVDDRYALKLYATNDGRGYWVGYIHPMHFDDHDQIVRGGLLLRAGRWRVYEHPNHLRHFSGWPAIQAAWNDGGVTEPSQNRPVLSESHHRYLERLQTLVDQGRRIAVSGGSGQRYPYRKVSPVAATRRSARSVHVFQLIGDNRLTTRSRVYIDGEPDLRGRVERIDEGVARVRFERPVDFRRIPATGAFAESPNLTAFDKQQEAIDMLREGRAHNPLLLPTLVDRVFHPFQPAVHVRPVERLDDSQLSAFHKALAVPDLALIQGPPGTGKTHTIKQIVLACAAFGHKVLISSYTNRAVDNVLKDLPASLLVLRVGREDGITRDCEHLTLEARAVGLQRHILDRTEPVLQRYSVADPEDGTADALFRQFTWEMDNLAESTVAVRRSAGELANRDAAVTEHQRRRLDSLEEADRQHQQMLAEKSRLSEELQVSLDSARRAAEIPLAGVLFRRRLRRLEEKWLAAENEVQAVRHTLGEIARDRNVAENELAHVRATHPELRAARRAHERNLAEQRSRAERAAQFGTPLRELLGEDLPPIAAEEEALAAFHTAAESALELMRRRLSLLRSWRDKLGRRTEQLYGELVRYADVIGATCIGSATSEHLDDIGFDLAVVDEAGQISTADVLVPLVRARRAVLVGDHVQLPPLPDRALVDWTRAKHPEDPELGRLVTHSAFELVFPSVPPQNKELLRFQRRMPELLARFISDRFYGGFLETDVKRSHRDDLFATPLAFVDTSELPPGERRDRHPNPNEPWPESSRLNECEAELISRLAAYYYSRSGDWAVILPYAAQIGLVTDLLAERVGDESAVARRVATVDSFQGGQHDTIIFGFTLSNRAGQIGFLNEIRRLNVAFSRAKQRLILIGDLATLLNATDPSFRDLAEALHDYVKRVGDLQNYHDTMRRLREGP